MKIYQMKPITSSITYALSELSFNKGGSVSFTDCNTVSNAYINKML